jgi:RNA polymerase sigma-70 factor (ECF subfamily)
MIDDWPRVFSRVKAALRLHGRTGHDAEDLVQEAFVRLANYERQNVVEKPEAFLMTTAINLSTDSYRARASRGEQVLLEDDVLVDTAPGIEEVMLSRERIDRLSECLQRLPEKTRNIFLAHRVEGLPYKEIARLHGLSVSSVEKHMAKAMLMLSNGMEGWYP